MPEILFIWEPILVCLSLELGGSYNCSVKFGLKIGEVVRVECNTLVWAIAGVFLVCFTSFIYNTYLILKIVLGD